MAVKISYSNREFQTVLSEIKSSIAAELPDSNDFLESSIGRVLLDYVAAIGDMTNFYIDRSAAECFIDTCETRAGLTSLLKLLNLQPQNPVPETAQVEFKINVVATSDIDIPIFTILSDANGRPWATAEASKIAVGTTGVTIDCIQGSWKAATFFSNGGVNQRFIVSSYKVAEGYIRVFVDGVEWLPAMDNSFVGSSTTDNVFRVVNMFDRRVMVELGNGKEGRIPVKGSEIEVRFFDTENVAGRAKSGEINSLSFQNEVSITVNNPLGSNGGRDYETIDSARYRYPAVFKTLRRAVTLDDWEALAEMVPGVMQAKAVDINIDNTIPFFMVYVYVVGNNGSTSPVLNEKVKNVLNKRKVNATLFKVLSPLVRDVDISLDLYHSRIYSGEVVRSAVHTAIEDFFTMTNEETSEVKLGTKVALSRLISRIQSIPGVVSITMNAPTSDILVYSYQYAKLKNITINVKGAL